MSDHPYGPFVSAETVEYVARRFDGRATEPELAWLSSPQNLATLLAWCEEHEGEEFLLGDSPDEDGGIVEPQTFAGTDAIVNFLEEPWHWVGELRAMQMSEALREEREHRAL